MLRIFVPRSAALTPFAMRRSHNSAFVIRSKQVAFGKRRNKQSLKYPAPIASLMMTMDLEDPTKNDHPGNGGGAQDDQSISQGSRPESNDDSSTNTPRSGSHSSTTGTSFTGGMSGKNAIPEDIVATKETRAVQYSRLMVLAVIILSAIVAGVLTYILTTDAEEQDFQVQFADFALAIDDTSQQNSNAVYLVLESLTATITSYALKTNMAWPNVTIPHWEIRGEKFRAVTGSHLVSIAPTVYNVDEWNAYAEENQGWIQDAYDMRGDGELVDEPFPAQMYYRTEDNNTKPEIQVEGIRYSPLWQEAAAPVDVGALNYNLLSHEIYGKVWRIMKASRAPVLSEVFDPSELLGRGALKDFGDGQLHPESILVQPIFQDFSDNSEIVGTIVTVLTWDTYFSNLLHEGAKGLNIIMRDTCGDVFSYLVDGPNAIYLGEGDVHDPKYDHMEYVVPFGPPHDKYIYEDNDDANEHCLYTLHIFPTQTMEDSYSTSRPVIFTVTVVLIFLFTSFVFLCYDYLVQRRQEMVQSAAVKSNAIVSSLFPAEVRDRLYQHANETDPKGKGGGKNKDGNGNEPGAKFRLKSYLDDHGKDNEGDDDEAKELAMSAIPEMYETKPIADLFPNATVMFADIAGFTAWSSVREPSQVFTLLETVYKAFDSIAKRRRVFKVETVGDCYVAVTGLPEPRKDHAVIMARFARECMVRMNELTRHLEVILGPDTGDLAMRFGLHSGPVTAGVLRGEKSRFQLFGDTVNTAARIESTGLRDRIHISRDTADLLKEAGKDHWVVAREDTVIAKGKGELATYWLLPKDGANKEAYTKEVNNAIQESKGEEAPTSTVVEKSIIPKQTAMSPKIQRLVDWNVDVLKRLLKLIVAKRVAAEQHGRQSSSNAAVQRAEKVILSRNGMPLNEVTEIITLPKFDAKTQRNRLDPQNIKLSDDVVAQLREFIEAIAGRYRDNPFHNFEHASHVTMSVSKLLSRIVAPDIEVDNHDDIAANLHDHTYGITSDPLTQVAVVLSALIHDVDHVGIPNFLLSGENKSLAMAYDNKSIAEQNSVDVAWETLMQSRFSKLRAVIYTNPTELARFRQLIANTVLATDIFDKELQALRKKRWEMAFSDQTASVSSSSSSNREVDVNRKATIVIEHLIQASDVAHTMQHWHIYQKWNEKLFAEMLNAYKSGRWDRDPGPGWYEGELGFFDNYVIPLAKKLKDCGVFGVSSDEYLNYALENRREWSNKGQDVVQKMIQKYGDVAKPVVAPVAAVSSRRPSSEAAADADGSIVEKAATEKAAAAAASTTTTTTKLTTSGVYVGLRNSQTGSAA